MNEYLFYGLKKINLGERYFVLANSKEEAWIKFKRIFRQQYSSYLTDEYWQVLIY